MTAFMVFAPLLRRAGFRKKWASRAGGARVAEWCREEPDGRTLVCQIWEDGRHRLNHEWCGCSDTRPTDFKTEDELAAAIQRETTRGDSRYRDPNNHHVPSARDFLQAKQVTTG